MSAPSGTAARALAHALLEVDGVLTQIIDHMLTYGGRAAPDAPPMPEVLRSVLGRVLTPLADARPADVERTAALLDAALDVIAAEIHLVPLDPPPLDRARPRSRRHARRPA